MENIFANVNIYADMMLRKIRTCHQHKEGRIFSWTVLIMSFGIGLTLPIFPNFVKSILKTDTAVSLFYSAMALVMFLAAVLSTIVFKKVERTTITKISLLTSGIVFLLLIFVSKITELAILNTIKVWFNLFLLMALSLFVRDFAKDKELGEEEGIFYKFNNIGYFAGPLLGGFLAIYFNYEFVFILTATILIGGLIYFYHKHIIQKHPAIINRKKTSASKTFHKLKEYFLNGERTKIYIISTLLMIWVGFRRLYIPLYVITTGLNESATGIILALGIIPLILLEVGVGKYADKKGIKIPISVGFLLIALCLSAIFLSQNIWLNFVLLIICSVGTALIEPLQEYYLFKNLPKEKEEDLYGIYMTADPIAYFLAPTLGALILLLLPFNYLFIIFGILMLGGAVFSYTTLRH
ncbi:MFS transporter [Candidatus Peregrinibacteria bacterium]|nr:MFS transporter [Candidatus Peregrinibacteria bacterium]